MENKCLNKGLKMEDKIDMSMIDKLSKLSMLYFTDEEKEHLLGEVNGIVEMLNKCGEFNVSSNPNERRVKFSELREDEVCESMDIDTAFQDVNSRIKDYYAVDKVVDL